MFDKLKKATGIGNVQEPSLNEMVMRAKMELAAAKRQNENVIRMERRQLMHYREQANSSHTTGASESENFSKQKLKKAYYALYAIRETEFKISDVYSTQMLYDAMNKYTAALKCINNFKSESGKPKNLSYKYQQKKLFGENGEPTSKEVNRVDKMYQESSLTLDDLVSDDIVEDLINGQELNNCLNDNIGVMVNYDDFSGITADIDMSKADLSNLQG